jgi:hypothetical protein
MITGPSVDGPSETPLRSFGRILARLDAPSDSSLLDLAFYPQGRALASTGFALKLWCPPDECYWLHAKAAAIGA